MSSLYSPTFPKTFSSIQALRGVSCVLVVLFHSTLQLDIYYHQSFLGNWFTRGYYGVDLFFVISGFVITHSSIKLWNDPSNFSTYWHKRIVRVYPMYWLILLPVAVGTWLTVSSASQAPVPITTAVGNAIATLLLWPGHLAVNGVSWTLSHELYFYLLFSLLILSARLWFIPIAICVGSAIYAFVKPTDLSWPITADFLLSPFNIEFALGVLAWFILKRYFLPTWLNWVLISLAGLWLVAYQSMVTNEDHTRRVLIFGCSAFLLLLAFISLDMKNKLRTPGWLSRLGDASYVLYLLHLPALIVINKLILFLPHTSQSVYILNIISVVLILYVSLYIHRRMEKPLLKYLSRRSAPVISPVPLGVSLEHTPGRI